MLINQLQLFIYSHLKSRITNEEAQYDLDISLKALHSTVWPSMSRDGTNFKTCDVTSPPFSPTNSFVSVLLVMGLAFLYHVIDDAGFEESVVHVNVILLSPFE